MIARGEPNTMENFVIDTINNFFADSLQAIVSLRVLNKTADEYWFLMKINITAADENVKIQSFDQSTKSYTEYFLVRLLLGSVYL